MSPATQTTLVNNIVNLAKTNGYDGVDMDWESGEENDGADMTAKFKSLHKELREALDKLTLQNKLREIGKAHAVVDDGAAP